MTSRYVILRDFVHAYDLFPLKVIDADDWLERHVLRPLIDAFQDAFEELVVLELAGIRSTLGAVGDDRHFVVTLDGGSYFKEHDFSFDITRTCYDLKSMYGGGFPRLPRAPRPQFYNQAVQLRDAYIRRGQHRQVLLCDDGIDTGDSLREIIRLLRQIDVPIDRILVLLNQHGLDRLDDLEVTTAFTDVDLPYEWVSERDLYWGLPRSGLSFTWPDSVDNRYGIPYTIDERMIQERMRVPFEHVGAIRNACITANIAFWEYLERGHMRALTFEDCDRLAFFHRIGGERVRIVDYLESIRCREGSFVEPPG